MEGKKPTFAEEMAKNKRLHPRYCAFVIDGGEICTFDNLFDALQFEEEYSMVIDVRQISKDIL